VNYNSLKNINITTVRKDSIDIENIVIKLQDSIDIARCINIEKIVLISKR